MTSVQVSHAPSSGLQLGELILLTHNTTSPQNVFILDEGDSVRGELERRKFTVEEGDHLTALNAYNAFVKCRSCRVLGHISVTLLMLFRPCRRS